MKAGINDRDWELLSACLDSRLSPADMRIVEARLASDPDFKNAYISLLKTRAILRSAPTVKRRRNYYLTPEMARQRRWTWLLPVINVSSAATGLAALILLMSNLLPAGMKAAPSHENMAAQAVEAPAGPSTGMSAEQSIPTLAYQADSPVPFDAAKESGGEPVGTQPEMGAGQPQGLMAPAPGIDNAVQEKQEAAPAGEEPVPAPPAAAPMLIGGTEPAQDQALNMAAAPAEELKAAGAIQVTPTAPAAALEGELHKAEVAATVTVQPTAKIMEGTAPREYTIPAESEKPKDAAAVAVNSGQAGGYLLLVSALLGLTGIFLRKRMR